MKMATLPNALPNGHGILNKAGAAPEPGGTRYFDMATGNHTTVFEALVITTGARFSMVAVKGNQVLNKVRVDHDVVFGGRVPVGETLLAGAIKMVETGAVATKAWAFRAPTGDNGHLVGNRRPLPPRPPRPARHVGSVSRVHPRGFAEVLEDRTGRRYFAHMSNFGGGARMTAGFRCSFTPAETARGWVALDIKPQD